MVKTAEFSECGKYRYQLTRIWDESLPVTMCIGLNPSKADSEKDDPTIRILIRMLQALGYGGFKMMNLYGLITPHPNDLRNSPDPVGINDQWLASTAYHVQDIIYFWGTFKHIEHRVKKVREILPEGKCFGKTQNGYPWHPMALMYLGVAPKNVKLLSF